jgi:transcriptional regulator with XRE-family HTH domain
VIYLGIDYKAIGARVRNARKKLGITQLKLAEYSEQTPTNISHIETGNTKVSLPTIIKIANALSVSVDNLLCDNIIHSRAIFENELSDILKDCNEKEIRIIIEFVRVIKKTVKEITLKEQIE